jgi:magnesium-transporting ATPase (P-type)
MESAQRIGLAPTPWHTLGDEEVINRLGGDARSGLDHQEVEERLKRIGYNRLPASRSTSILLVVTHQFVNPLIYLLLAAAGIALWLGEIKDAVVILAVVTLNAMIGSIQEGRAERSIDSLRRFSTLNTRVIRGGKEQAREASELVPGAGGGRRCTS